MRELLAGRITFHAWLSSAWPKKQKINNLAEALLNSKRK
jgi:hypothetical protein